jgi:hypothetical protein
MTQAKAAYSVKSWARNAWDGVPAEVTGAQLFRIEMIHIYKGDIEGEGTIQYLLTQNNEDGQGNFIALEKVTGSVGGRSGSYVFQRIGAFDANWRI